MADPARTVRDQFLVELSDPQARAKITDLAMLNELFTGWVETIYHQREHTETKQTPLERLLAAGPPVLPTPQLLREAFLWSEHRRVSKTATLSLHGNRYEVDTALVGRRVEVVFDPLDLTTLEVRYQGRSMGLAVPHQIGRHVHPQARRDLSPPAAAKTGVDYLALIAQQHRAQAAVQINYRGMSAATQPIAADAAAADAAITATPDAAATVEPNAEYDRELEAELASFAVLGKESANDEIPGQLALTHLTHEPTATTAPARGTDD